MQPSYQEDFGQAGLDAGQPAACKEIYLRIARQAPLDATLARIAALAEQEQPSSTVLLFRFTGDVLRLSASPAAPASLVRSLDGIPYDRAPWRSLHGTAQAIGSVPAWNEFANAVSGFEWCWSDRIETSAGEAVGDIAVFFPLTGAPPRFDPRQLSELTELAALAIEQSHLLEELTHQARHEAVTGLWNRRYFAERLEDWNHGSPAAVSAAFALAALDGVHRVREILGEETADALVAEAAARLRSHLRASDLAARLSGDEFVVVAPGPPGPAHATALGARLLELLTPPFDLGGHEIHLTPAIGVAPVSAGGAPHEWSRQARAALAAARRGRNGGRAVCFDPSLPLTTPERLAIEKRLRAALPNGEILLYYQPQVASGSLRIAGYEALMRWRDPDVGLVSPGLFIPIAEESGLISSLGRWALQEACRQARHWELHGLPARVGVNVSALQLADPGFFHEVEGALEAGGLTPNLLELEITESMLVENCSAAADRMHALRQLGVEFALDDFGTGSSSLSYLKDLPFQRIKIDRSFLSELRAGSGAAPLLESIIVLAHNLNLPVIVEGIETEHHLDAVTRLGADEIQGFLTGRPMPPDEASAAALRPPGRTSDI